MAIVPEQAQEILQRRYYRNGETKPEQMFHRVAYAVAAADVPLQKEEWAKKFYNMMYNLDFLPNSPTLMNAGTALGQLSACFVLPVPDHMDGIFTALYNMAMVQKSGGGTGFSFSQLRPKGTLVTSTYGQASGPVSFMRIFNAATEEIKQGGTRRGANMGMLRVDHPDILEFIHCKDKEGDFSNFNISVAITDEFMQAVVKDDVYQLCHPTTGFVGKFKAREVFAEIVHQAWKNGEPGIVFIDTINQNTILEAGSGLIQATNPCGEQPLLDYESCCLGSINLANMVMTSPGMHAAVNWSKLTEVVQLAVRFLDNVIDANKYPLPEIERRTKLTRKIGLGVMGWADMLFKLGMRYDSQEAVDLAGDLMEHVTKGAREASRKLRLERGPADGLPSDFEYRNATVTTIAPTGTISLIAGVSSGIEPVFALAYRKQVIDGEMWVVNQVFEDWLKDFYSDEERAAILEQVVKEGGRYLGAAGHPFVTAMEVSPKWHVMMQSAFQAFTDNAVSKTVNLPNDATEQDVADIFQQAWESECKGVTVYRQGSRQVEALTVKSSKKPRRSNGTRKRPRITHGFTEQVQTGCGKIYVTVNFDEHGPMEVFVQTGASGGCAAFAEGVARMISLSLRSGVPLDKVIDQLASVKCSNFIRRAAIDDSLVGKSCPDVIARVLRGASKKEPFPLLEGSSEKTDSGASGQDSDSDPVIPCPDCGFPLEHEGGCLTCKDCGWSKCSG